jgi:predicted Rossmann fold flavoprotein
VGPVGSIAPVGPVGPVRGLTELPIVIVGAGAAGLATAIFARRSNPSVAVSLLEGAKTPGAKILVSGGARCNVTNAAVAETDFWGGKSTIVRRILKAFPVEETVAFFEEIGVHLHEEADGKLFPDTNRARDVLAALLAETERAGAALHSARRVLDILPERDRFLVRTAQGDIHARAVVLATGGRSLPKTGSDGAGLAIAERLGHTIVPTTPGLAPLVLSDETNLHKALSGVAHDVELTIWNGRAAATRLTGAMLWTHFGVSGPVALNASRHWMRAEIEHRDRSITVNLWPPRSFDEADADLMTMAGRRPKSSIQAALATSLPASVASCLLQHLGIDASLPLSQLPRESRRTLAHALVALPLPVAGTRGYNHAEVTAGGVALDEVDPSTMASRVCPGLYLVGEILDVDGRIGGFNFQWAWATARVAARGLERSGVVHHR